jgi:hypothetical protein
VDASDKAPWHEINRSTVWERCDSVGAILDHWPISRQTIRGPWTTRAHCKFKKKSKDAYLLPCRPVLEHASILPFPFYVRLLKSILLSRIYIQAYLICRHVFLHSSFMTLYLLNAVLISPVFPSFGNVFVL